jgi:hypothetical protein
MKKLCIFITFILIFIAASSHATTYFINTQLGNDDNKGTHQQQPWKTILPLQQIKLKAGDAVLFATGQRFSGMLSLADVSGSAKYPIVISSYIFKGNKQRPLIDAGDRLNAILIQNSSFIQIKGIEITANAPYQHVASDKKQLMRCGILVEVNKEDKFEGVTLDDVLVHDVYLMPAGYKRTAAETKTANGTEGYGWGIRFINNSKKGQLNHIKVLRTTIFNVSHTGLKFTAPTNGIQQVTVANCTVYDTGGPGMQLSGVTTGHFHHNIIHHSGSTKDSRNWGRGSGLWTWGSSNILIEHNRFENANGPGDSAGIHIDFNCNDVVVQYNLSANNAGGFCEILGNNYNCAYRYNVSINDGFRQKGVNGAFQEGKIFWLSGYQGDQKKKSGPYNSYFYNNTMYVAAHITPKIAVSSSSKGVFVANNIFYFETDAQVVAGDQKKQEIDLDSVTNVFFQNNLYLRASSWPDSALIHDAKPVLGDPKFLKNGSLSIADYLPANTSIVKNKGIEIKALSNDSIGLRIGLKVKKDILDNMIKGLPDMGAIELK